MTASPFIIRPGAYDGVPAEVYHSPECTPHPALSSSGARLITAECPALFYHRTMSPAVSERKEAFDIGTAAHLMILELDLFAAKVSVIEADSYRSGAAKEAREAAYEAGKTPLLMHEAEAIKAMRAALFSHPIAAHAFSGGVAERSLFWIDQDFGVWRKCRPDYLPEHSRYLVDYKTSTSANPRTFQKRAADFGYHQQAAWYMDGVEAITGERPQRFAFIVQDKNPPYLVSVCWLDEEAIEWGRLLNRRALAIFARCMESGEWPGYRDDLNTDAAFTIGLPTYTKRDLETRLDAGEFADPAFKRAVEAHAPPQAAE